MAMNNSQGIGYVAAKGEKKDEKYNDLMSELKVMKIETGLTSMNFLQRTEKTENK